MSDQQTRADITEYGETLRLMAGVARDVRRCLSARECVGIADALERLVKTEPVVNAARELEGAWGEILDDDLRLIAGRIVRAVRALDEPPEKPDDMCVCGQARSKHFVEDGEYLAEHRRGWPNGRETCAFLSCSFKLADEPRDQR